MFSFAKASVLTAVIGLGALAAGCQSSGDAGKSAAGHKVGVECNACETTWARTAAPSYERGQAVAVVKRSGKAMECPDCKNEAANYLATGRGSVPGKVVHTCKTCGGEMKTCHVG